METTRLHMLLILVVVSPFALGGVVSVGLLMFGHDRLAMSFVAWSGFVGTIGAFWVVRGFICAYVTGWGDPKVNAAPEVGLEILLVSTFAMQVILTLIFLLGTCVGRTVFIAPVVSSLWAFPAAIVFLSVLYAIDYWKVGDAGRWTLFVGLTSLLGVITA